MQNTLDVGSIHFEKQSKYKNVGGAEPPKLASNVKRGSWLKECNDSEKRRITVTFAGKYWFSFTGVHLFVPNNAIATNFSLYAPQFLPS